MLTNNKTLLRSSISHYTYLLFTLIVRLTNPFSSPLLRHSFRHPVQFVHIVEDLYIFRELHIFLIPFSYQSHAVHISPDLVPEV